MKFLCTFLFLTLYIISPSQGQVQILHDPISARTFDSEKYSGVNGSPFLHDNWIKGIVNVGKGTYRNLELKLDAVSNVLYFNRNDELFEFEEPVISFVLMPRPNDSSSYQSFRNGFSGDGLRSNQFVQVLTNGTIMLLRSDAKLITDVNEINRGTIRTFSNTSRYYILEGDKTRSIKLSKDDIYDLVKDEQAAIDAYVSQNKLSTKKPEDLIKILKYYNSL